jgi:glycosyltransferase involved in cell wall biosynthesis
VRILITSPYLPWPLWSGGNAAQFSTLHCLAQDHDFTLVCPVYSEAQRGYAQELQGRLPAVRVRAVFCGTRPQPLSSRVLHRGAGVARSLLKPLLHRGADIPVRPLPWYPFQPLPEPLVAALQEELDRGTDLCQAEFAEMLPLGSWFPDELPKLFIQHQVHFVYAQRFLTSQGGTDYGRYLETTMRTQEVAFLRRFDQVVVFGEADKLALAPYLDSSRLNVSPFPIPADVGVAREIAERFDGRFLFIGSEEHDPNRDALDWLLSDIWPGIARQLPQAQLTVVGRWSESARASYARGPVRFAGFVDNLVRVLRGGILLVPLKIGSGICTKILAALAQGVPVVTTPVGVEGLAVPDGCGCLVRSNPTEFANAAVELARQPELWSRVASSGMRAVAYTYSPESVRRRRNEIYSAVVQAHSAAGRVGVEHG